jgi:hypothetical protein
VLLHVLVTSVVIALIAATLMRLALLRYSVTARALKTTQERRLDEMALNAVISNWNKANTLCGDASAANYICSPLSASPPGACGCTCTPRAAGAPANSPTLVTLNVGGVCQLTIGANNDIP